MSIFSFDVESIGLYGDVFAVGIVILSDDNTEVESLFLRADDKLAAGLGTNRQWVKENVIPTLEPINCSSLRDLRDSFWNYYISCKTRYPNIVFVADCGSPCESGFLKMCVLDDLENRQWSAPFPLHEVGTALYLCGKDPTASYDRKPNELPIHNPVNDARMSGRVWLECQSHLQSK